MAEYQVYARLLTSQAGTNEDVYKEQKVVVAFGQCSPEKVQEKRCKVNDSVPFLYIHTKFILGQPPTRLVYPLVMLYTTLFPNPRP